MFSSFFKPFYYFSFFVLLITICISCFAIPIVPNIEIEQLEGKEMLISPYGFAWPIPGYTTITSYFGKRNSPTSKASSFHKGLDIGAPEGTTLIAVVEGQITYVGFLGGGGYTITLSKENMKITYCHVSPNFIVQVGQQVQKGQIIGQVGPKYVYGVKGNTYQDATGKPTNGATTGCHLHLGIRIEGEYIDPLQFYQSVNGCQWGRR